MNNCISGTYDGYSFHIERENRISDNDWYIIVHKDGKYLHDKWWNRSKDKTLSEAISYACEASQIPIPKTLVEIK